MYLGILGRKDDGVTMVWAIIREANRRSAKKLRGKNGEKEMWRHRGGADETFMELRLRGRATYNSSRQHQVRIGGEGSRVRETRKRERESRSTFSFHKKDKETRDEAVGTRVVEWAKVGLKPSWWRFVKAWVYPCVMGQQQHHIWWAEVMRRPTPGCTTWSHTTHIYTMLVWVIRVTGEKQQQQVIASEISQQDTASRERRLQQGQLA